MAVYFFIGLSKKHKIKAYSQRENYLCSQKNFYDKINDRVWEI